MISQEKPLARPAVRWGTLLASMLLAAIVVVLAWLATAPWASHMCPAIYPAPLACSTSGRVAISVGVTLVAILLAIVTLMVVLRGLRRSYPIAMISTVLLAILALATHPIVTLLLTW